MTKSTLFIAISALFIHGCTSLHSTSNNMQADLNKKTQTIQEKNKVRPASAVVEHMTDNFLDFKPIGLSAPVGDVELKANGMPLGAILADLAKKNGFSLAFTEDVNPGKKINAEFRNGTLIQVIHDVAFMAGYVAIVNKDLKTITVANEGTITYKVPASLMQNFTSTYNVGGNPVASNSSSSGGSSGNSAAGGGGLTASSDSSASGSMKAEFVVQGKSVTNGMTLGQMVKDVAGKNAEVYFALESGYLSVKANAQALKRVTDLMKAITKDALTQVTIDATIVEVSLKDDFSRGVDWSKVIAKSSTLSAAVSTIGNTSAALGTAPTLSLSRTSSADTVINVLRTFADTNVISRPRIVTTNHIAATLFEGQSEPYLSNIQVTTIPGTTPTVEKTGVVSYAINGINLSVHPNVVDSRHVQVSIIPVINNILEFKAIPLPGESASSAGITAPRQSTKESFMRVLAETGKTMVLGGIKYSANKKNANGVVPYLLEGRSDIEEAKEMVIMLNVDIKEPLQYDPIISESL